jgi:hypothetical protein
VVTVIAIEDSQKMLGRSNENGPRHCQAVLARNRRPANDFENCASILETFVTLASHRPRHQAAPRKAAFESDPDTAQ